MKFTRLLNHIDIDLKVVLAKNLQANDKFNLVQSHVIKLNEELNFETMHYLIFFM